MCDETLLSAVKARKRNVVAVGSDRDDDEEIEFRPAVKRARRSRDGLGSRWQRRSIVADASMYGTENELANSGEGSDGD